MIQKLKKVLTPKWWNEIQYVGFTDAVDTYAAEAIPSWFVVVPKAKYYGYFHKSDLRVIGTVTADLDKMVEHIEAQAWGRSVR